jgi:hypothetical protein
VKPRLRNLAEPLGERRKFDVAFQVQKAPRSERLQERFGTGLLSAPPRRRACPLGRSITLGHHTPVDMKDPRCLRLKRQDQPGLRNYIMVNGRRPRLD